MPSLHDIQKTHPWSTTGARAYKQENLSDERQVAHAVLHAVKAAGRLSEQIEASEHVDASVVSAEGAKKYIADLVIIAMRLANILNIDLEQSVIERIKEKNPDWQPIDK